MFGESRATLAAQLDRLAGRRPERAALVLAAVVVATGAVAATVRVVEGVADARVEYRGELDVGEIHRTFHPTGADGLGDPVPGFLRAGHGYIVDGQAVMTVPGADGITLALWAIRELAPWLLAAIALALLAPLLRAARRGDPFSQSGPRRLAAIGLLLLVGLPGIAIVRYAAAESASAASVFASPMAQPALTLSALQILPGLLVLVLAGVFRTGLELRDFERHTI
jgi:hypothetical protein